MKKTFAMLFALGLVIGLTGCKSQQKAEEAPMEDEVTAVEETEAEVATTPMDEDDAFIASLRYHDAPAPAPAAESAPAEAEVMVEEEPIGEMITSKDLRKGGVNEELLGVARSHEEYKNIRFRTVDINTRALVDDWERLWLMDRPSRSSLYPIR